MKKVLLYITFLIFLVSITNAITITPTNQEVKIFSNLAKNVFINVTNEINESIYSVHLSSDKNYLTFVDNDFNLTSGESKEIKIAVNTASTFSENTIIKVIFYKRVGVILTPQTLNIGIDQNGFQPQNIEIVKGSTIVWTNNDTIKHSVTSTQFDNDLNQGNTFSFTFNSIGNIEYYDKFTNYNGKVTVIESNGLDLAHNPTLDKEFTLFVNSRKVETELNVDFLENNSFIIEANTLKDSVLIIKNIGNKTAENIELKGEWISFGKQNIYLAPGEQTYVTYTIQPSILVPEKTNITYINNIIISSNNTLDVIRNVSIYVPLQSNISINDSLTTIFNQSFTPEFLLALRNAVCELYKDHPTCKVELKEIVVYKIPPIPYNHTQEDVHRYLREVQEDREKWERFQIEINDRIFRLEQTADTTKNSAIIAKEKAEELFIQAQNNSKDIDAIFTFFIIIFIIIGIIGFTFFGLKYFIKKEKEKKIIQT